MDPTGIVVAKLANKLLRQIDQGTSFGNGERESSIPWFDRNELVLNKLLGTGGFNSVYSIHEVASCPTNSATSNNNASQTRKRDRVAKDPQNYAIKFLREQVLKKNEDFANGALDLVVEAKILANLRHPNIVGLHGVSIDGVDGLMDRVEGNFFLVLDRLTCTLRDRLRVWRKNHTPPPFVDRLQVARQIAEALCYLSRKKVLHRDLKPENIGFTKDNKAKLYDFGLAKVLPDKGGDEFQLTAMTGTIRYMSPQCAMKQKYGLSADVYSFSLILWELAALQQPFDGLRGKEIVHKLSTGSTRLPVKHHWPASIKNIIKRGCDHDSSARPSMDRMLGTVSRQIARYGGEDRTSGEDSFDRFQAPHRKNSDSSAESR